MDLSRKTKSGQFTSNNNPATTKAPHPRGFFALKPGSYLTSTPPFICNQTMLLVVFKALKKIAFEVKKDANNPHLHETCAIIKMWTVTTLSIHASLVVV